MTDANAARRARLAKGRKSVHGGSVHSPELRRLKADLAALPIESKLAAIKLAPRPALPEPADEDLGPKVQMRVSEAIEHRPSAVSCNGRTYATDAFGRIEIPERYAEMATSHGFELIQGAAPPAVDPVSQRLASGMTRRQLFKYCAACDLALPDNLSVEGLRRFVVAHMSEAEA